MRVESCTNTTPSFGIKINPKCEPILNLAKNYAVQNGLEKEYALARRVIEHVKGGGTLEIWSNDYVHKAATNNTLYVTNRITDKHDESIFNFIKKLCIKNSEERKHVFPNFQQAYDNEKAFSAAAKRIKSNELSQWI